MESSFGDLVCLTNGDLLVCVFAVVKRMGVIWRLRDVRGVSSLE